MEKRYKTKAIGISLIAIGSLIVLTVFAIIIGWELIAILIGIAVGCYLVKLGIDRLKPGD